METVLRAIGIMVAIIVITCVVTLLLAATLWLVVEMYA